MFVRVSALLVAIAASVIALPGGTITTSECDNGSVQCCNQTFDVTGDNLPGFSGCKLVASASECSQQAVCCNNNQMTGDVVIGCSPITVNL